MRIALVVVISVLSMRLLAAEEPIDRFALVTRHNIQWNEARTDSTRQRRVLFQCGRHGPADLWR